MESMYPRRVVQAPSIDAWVTYAVLLRVKESAQVHLERQNEALAVVTKLNDREHPPTWYVVVRNTSSEALQGFLRAVVVAGQRSTRNVYEAALFDSLEAATQAATNASPPGILRNWKPALLSDWILITPPTE